MIKLLKNVKETYKREKTKSNSPVTNSSISRTVSGIGNTFEYVMKIPMGFYNVPIIIAFLVAILVACLQNRSVKFDQS